MLLVRTLHERKDAKRIVAQGIHASSGLGWVNDDCFVGDKETRL